MLRILKTFNLQLKKNFSSSLVYNILDNHTVSLEGFFELQLSKLPDFDCLSQCLSFAHLRVLNQDEESILGFFDDKNGVQEEMSSIAVVRSNGLAFNCSKFWAWKDRKTSLSRCNVVLEKRFEASSKEASANFIFTSLALPNAGIKIVENHDRNVDDCISCEIHFENVFSDEQS